VDGDIELEVSAGSPKQSYVVRVVYAVAGGEPTGTLQLDVDDILGRRDLLEATLLSSAVTRRAVSAAERPVREVGQLLFQALFTGPVYGMYRACLGVAQQRGRRLRVVLRLTAPELAALPWETMFDPEIQAYLCRQEPLVRHVPAPYTPDPLDVRLPLRILGLVSSPRGLPPLDTDAEKAHLAEALKGPVAEGLIELAWEPLATWAGIQALLLSGQWHVLHFIGHGDYDAKADEGVLALVGENGRADMVAADRIADLLAEAQPAPRLVVLNSCSSGQSGTRDLFSGTAATLARSGISAVAAMQFSITDTAAIAFARGFYTAIAHGRGVDEAARSGRIAILGVPRSLEWITPVLYLRGQATQLFTLSARTAATAATGLPPSAVARPGPPRPGPGQAEDADVDRRRRAQLRALYIEARAELRLGHLDNAIDLLDDLLDLDPHYSDAAALRDGAQRARRLAASYQLAIAAEKTGDWEAAIGMYQQILGIDPDYRDAGTRNEACEQRQQAADLYAELLRHASGEQWQAVLDVAGELSQLDPSWPDPDGLAARARASLEGRQRTADPQAKSVHAVPLPQADQGPIRGLQPLHSLIIDIERRQASEDAPPLWRFQAPADGLIGVFDGLGGAGGETIRLPDGSEQTGAWLASRYVRRVVLDVYDKLIRREANQQPSGDIDSYNRVPGWRESRKGTDFTAELRHAIQENLSELGARLHASSDRRLKNRLVKTLPTTLAICRYDLSTNEFEAIWAGDSRIFCLRPEIGLQQVTTDDLRLHHDALEMLTQDSPMSNFVSADTNFVLHERRIELHPFSMLIAATDGCYAYVPTPLHFEHMLLSTMQEARDWQDWQDKLHSQIDRTTGDDATLSAVAIGWPDFASCREHYAARAHWCAPRISTRDAAAQEDRAAITRDLWAEYRRTYEMPLSIPTRNVPDHRSPGSAV
jgi:tetratricopeptide (TPR) repeat protein